MRLSRKDRQKIVDDFVERHGKYDARMFMEEVKATAGQHPAWTWFVWDDEKAADEYRIWQAREFTHDLKVKFSIEVMERGSVKGRQTEGPDRKSTRLNSSH